jgi:hypothetical protein
LFRCASCSLLFFSKYWTLHWWFFVCLSIIRRILLFPHLLWIYSLPTEIIHPIFLWWWRSVPPLTPLILVNPTQWMMDSERTSAWIDMYFSIDGSTFWVSLTERLQFSRTAPNRPIMTEFILKVWLNYWTTKKFH